VEAKARYPPTFVQNEHKLKRENQI